MVLDNFCLQQCALLNSKAKKDLYLWGTCQVHILKHTSSIAIPNPDFEACAKLILITTQLQETLAKKLVRVGLNKNVFTRKMEIQPRREYNFNFNFSDGN